MNFHVSLSDTSRRVTIVTSSVLFACELVLLAKRLPVKTPLSDNVPGRKRAHL